jgi:hypothetical protein
MLAPLVHSAMAMTPGDRAISDHAISMSMAAPMMAGHEMAGLPEDMPCCPGKASIPDCGNDCPFMALCSAMPFNLPVAVLAAPAAEAEVVSPGNQSDLVSVKRAPPRRPPKI